MLQTRLTLCTGCRRPGAGGGLQGGPVRGGESGAVPGQTQLVPASSNPPTSEHVCAPQPRWGGLGENVCKKGQNAALAVNMRIKV